jgi:hypothetical protein
MRGYLQRLVEPQADPAQGGAPAARPALTTRSPLAEADQRLHVESVADVLGVPGPPSLATQPEAVAESRTIPSYRARHAPAAPARAAPAAPAAKVAVQRYAMPAPPMPAAPAAQAASAMPGVPSATHTPSSAPALFLPPERGDAPAPQIDSGAPRTALSQGALPGETRPSPVAVVPAPAPLPSYETRAPLPPAPSPARAAPEEAETAPREAPSFAAEARPVAPSLPREPVQEREQHVRAPAHAREIPLADTAPVRTPEPPVRTRVIRETVRVPVEAPQKPSPPPQKLPRTAAEASVIGPLPRPERARAALELWLR